MEALNGASRTIAALITARMAEIDERIVELKNERQELNESRRIITGSKAGQKPGPKPKAGNGHKGRRNWTDGDAERLRAMATKWGSEEFGPADLAKLTKTPGNAMSGWMSHALGQGMLVRIERGVYRLSAKGLK